MNSVSETNSSNPTTPSNNNNPNSFFTPFIKEEWKDNIRNYKYKGLEKSITYKYFTSPLCNFLVKYIPSSIAPNVITLFGLLFNAAYVIISCAYTGLNGKEDTPNWVMITTGVLFFFYYIFDACDGKHARNTGNSSALGLLFDHGCDALTTSFIAIGFGPIIKLRK